MRNITITFDDGTQHVYQNAPDDITPDIVQKRAESQFKKTVTNIDGGRKQQEPTQQKASFAEQLATGLGKGFITGAGKIATNLADVTRRLNPWSTGEDIARSRAGLQQFEKESEGLPGFTTGQIGAQIAGTAGIPMPLSKGAGIVERIFAGAGAGGIAGGMVGGKEEIGLGAGVGAGVGALLPPIIKLGAAGIDVAKKIAEPLSKEGEKLISGRYLNQIIADENKAPIIKALREAEEIVDKSKPTSAEAVSAIPEGSPIQAHQALVSQEPKGISAAFGKHIQEQQAAREKALSFAGTEDDLERLITERTIAVKPLYEAVEKSTARVKASPVLGKVDEILKKNVNRTAIASPLTKIREALIVDTERGAMLQNNPQALKSLSDDISDMMGRKTIGGAHEFDVKVLNEIKTLLDDQIGKAEPAYKIAQQKFMELSKPINKMQIGQALKAKLVEPTGSETPGSYIRALANEKRLLKDSIGFGRKGIENYLTPEELSKVHKVAADLERQIASKRPLQQTNLRGGVDVAKETSLSLPNLLSRPAMLTNYVMKHLGKNVEPRIDAYFKYLYLNPQELAKVIEKLPSSERPAVMSKITEFANKTIPQISAATVVGVQ